jgi:hypothetical protein
MQIVIFPCNDQQHMAGDYADIAVLSDYTGGIDWMI